MIRDINLVEHLPKYVSSFEEIKTIMETENPEIQKVIDEQQKVFNNQFIKSCDENGIKKYEDLMGITPILSSTLDSRIKVVMNMWRRDIPYTYRVLIKQLDYICGKNGYKIATDFSNYKMGILVSLGSKQDMISLRKLTKDIVPANIRVTLIDYVTDDIYTKANLLNTVARLKTIKIN